MHGFNILDGLFIVADDRDIRVELTEELVEIIRKTIVIINENYHLSIPPLACCNAMTTALALFRHS